MTTGIDPDTDRDADPDADSEPDAECSRSAPLVDLPDHALA